MSILNEKEQADLISLGENIQANLSCDVNGTGLPCRTDRLEAVSDMKKYLEIHGYKISLEEHCYRRWQHSATSVNGDKYVGEYKDDNCRGSYHLPAGEKYIGEFKDGKPHGQGTLTFNAPHERAGEKYVGEYKDGNFHGQGTYTFAEGEKYVGEFKDGKPHGQGTNQQPYCCRDQQRMYEGSSVYDESFFKDEKNTKDR